MQHNPDNLSPETVETNKGYRLLNEDEIRGGPKLDEIELWKDQSHWTKYVHGACIELTYRTKLSPIALLSARNSLSLPTAPCHPESKAKPRASLYLIIPKWCLALMLLIDLLCIAVLLYILFHLK